MPKSYPCDYCRNNIPIAAERCPHCAKPGLFPNVRAADDLDERSKLNRRYQSAKIEAAARGADAILNNFEAALANSKAVIARSVTDVLRLAAGENEIYATYYQLTEGGLKLPDGEKWDTLRQLADTALFPNYKKDVRFAALSLDGIGLSNYGECSIVLRDDMIAHRASVFEENSTLFMKHNDIKLWDAAKLPKGYRAIWEDRAKLCIAKLSKKIEVTTRPDEYPGLLLRQGATSEEDEFVEVHIWGPMTARTIEQVIVTHPRPAKRATILKAVKAKLAKVNVRAS